MQIRYQQFKVQINELENKLDEEWVKTSKKRWEVV